MDRVDSLRKWDFAGPDFTPCFTFGVQILIIQWYKTQIGFKTEQGGLIEMEVTDKVVVVRGGVILS